MAPASATPALGNVGGRVLFLSSCCLLPKMSSTMNGVESDDETPQVSISESDDDVPQLSAGTMAALMEFFKEEEERKDKLRQIEEGEIPDTFEEDWNMSQFWYAAETSNCLAEECLRLAGNNGTIACVSSPTLYRTLRGMDHNCKLRVLEYDTRFAVYKEDFVLYDFKNPLAVPRDLRQEFDVVVADPPYLDEDCLAKMAITIKYLMKTDAKLILCTGTVLEELADRLLGVKKCKFEIKHDKQLSNPFSCYANYDLDSFCES
ncbi:EEF1A lysine methyltransferase 1-like [Penaeus monodon]|uniref:EEF1A lysine methyltransferase 1-like n=1 Tax=Penaeus monodon TaxID=6687 RepID=UPI0018A7988C|nr:EEF1A lysine methyltransferase 1-like [Penaeus monodon]